MAILENIPLAPYTTLGVGGPARFFLRARTEEQILESMEFARVRSLPVFVLGGGSNLVVSDSGFPGVVVKIENEGIRPVGDRDSGRISVAAGVEWDAFVQHSVSRNLAGIECLSGIPGTVGGTPVQNVGAHGEEAGEVIARVCVFDRESRDITDLSNADCKFAYRSSIFNTTHKNRYIILSVDFILRVDGQPRIHYPDLQKRFGGGAHLPHVQEVREAVLQARREKGMVLNHDDPDTKSAGSFFKNPILELAALAKMEVEAREKRALNPAESIPQYTATPGKVKVPAAWLIEHAGFRKGFVHKNAGISGKHALALINRGGASAQDILELMRLIQDQVEAVFGVRLQPEPIFVGEFR
ncbi:MAG: UDP-N-acetylmuramate dehydrogenase [Acidobacteria bacterium]|nr:UDP-N-acetylmuramate dehydrogenase [Acidobacteriota bacterium]